MKFLFEKDFKNNPTRVSLLGFFLALPLCASVCDLGTGPSTVDQNGFTTQPTPTHCQDLSPADCLKSQKLIGKVCEWDGTNCIDKVSPSEASGKLALHLKGPVFPQQISELVQAGRAVYENPNSKLVKARQKAFAQNQMGGGRSADWIEQTFGKPENTIMKELAPLEKLSTWTLAALDEAYQEAIKKNPPDSSAGLPIFHVVAGVGVNYLQDYPLGKDCILQLASQFNYLESPGTNKVKVSEYLTDHTQGPQGSIEAAAAALYRAAQEEVGLLPNALHRILPPNHDHFYRNGYLEPSKLSEAELALLNQKFSGELANLEILPQWAQCEPTGALQLQVFAAAPSYQYHTPPQPNSAGEQLCDLLVSAQYEAIAKLAVIRSIQTDAVVPLHLTLVGQSAFNNPPSVMKTSFAKVAKVVKGFPKVRVFIQAYTGYDSVAHAIDDTLFITKQMTKEEFSKEQP